MEQVIVEVDVSRSDKFPTGLEAYKDVFRMGIIVVLFAVKVYRRRTRIATFVIFVFVYQSLFVMSDDSAALETFLGFETDVQRYEYLLGSENVGTEKVVYSDEVYLAR